MKLGGKDTTDLLNLVSHSGTFTMKLPEMAYVALKLLIDSLLLRNMTIL